MLLHTRQSSTQNNKYHLWQKHKKQLCLCDTWYLLFRVGDRPVCRSICSCIPDSHTHRITSTIYGRNTRNNCVCATLGICYSVWVTVCYAGAYAHAYQTVTHTEQQVPFVAETQFFSPDDGSIVARNM